MKALTLSCDRCKLPVEKEDDFLQVIFCTPKPHTVSERKRYEVCKHCYEVLHVSMFLIQSKPIPGHAPLPYGNEK